MKSKSECIKTKNKWRYQTKIQNVGQISAIRNTTKCEAKSLKQISKIHKVQKYKSKNTQSTKSKLINQKFKTETNKDRTRRIGTRVSVMIKTKTQIPKSRYNVVNDTERSSSSNEQQMTNTSMKSFNNEPSYQNEMKNTIMTK